MKICQDILTLVTIGHSYSAFCVKTYIHFIVVVDLKSPRKYIPQVKWYQAVKNSQESINKRQMHQYVMLYVHSLSCSICLCFMQAHQRLKITKEHTIKPKEEAEQENHASVSNSVSKNLYCSVHRQVSKEYLCYTFF
jgi:hypothetical protein